MAARGDGHPGAKVTEDYELPDVDAPKQTWVHRRAASALNHASISPPEIGSLQSPLVPYLHL